MLRAVAKGFAERLLLLAAPRSGLRGRVLILAYHNIVPRGERPWGDASLHLPQDIFGRQLDLLAETLEVVPLHAALGAPADPGAPPRAVITWDDAYAGATTAGVEEVSRRGLSATMFVPPAFLDGGTFWWDALAGAAGALDAAQRRVCLEECRGRTELARSHAARAGWRWAEPPPHARGTATRDLERAAAVPGITLGSHTWSHPNLARATPEELTTELARARDWLQAFRPGAPAAVSYPYGLATAGVEREARAVGHEAGLRIEGGAFTPGADRAMAVPRLNVPAGLSLRGLALRLRGRLLA